jgi:aldehyde dehydrogenase (NAD+)
MVAPVHTRIAHLIAGRQTANGSEWIDVVNPATEEVIAAVPAGTSAEVELAVADRKSVV